MPRHPLDLLREAVRRTRELTADRPATGLGHDDADDELGTIATDDARDFDPLPLLKSLAMSGVRVAAIGQVAGILHGSTELTGDLDLLWDGDPARAQALAAAFARLDARLSDDDGAPLPLTPESFHLPKFQFATAGSSGDLCTPALPWGTLPVGDYLARALTTTDPSDGTEYHYLRREDLIAMRRAVGRPKDLRRAAELENPVTRSSASGAISSD
jgi:hypothetical protein